MSLAANILTYNGASAFIREAIGSVYDYCDEITVFDTGSTDGTSEIIKRSFPKINVSVYPCQDLGEVWTGSEKDARLTELLNIMKKETKSEWIVKVDDDEIFSDSLMKEIIETIKDSDNVIYTLPFFHVGAKTYKKWSIKRLFKNIPEVNWIGLYGKETLSHNLSRVSTKKCKTLTYPFYHLGGLRTDKDRVHDYSNYV